MNDLKPAMPERDKAAAKRAIVKHQQRPINPLVLAEPDSEGVLEFCCPYREEDQGDWEALIFQAFGTRSLSTARCFARRLAQLCESSFQDGVWVPDPEELNWVVNLINTARPRNEMEALHVASMAAIHIMQMRTASLALRWGHVDDRMAALSSKLARTSAMQMETLLKMRGKGTTRQKITVRHEKHIHQHQHVHFEGGASELGGQPQAAKGLGNVGKAIEGACQPARCAALPSPDAEGRVVPIRRGEGEEGLPDAWGRKRIRRSEGPG
jgi:hypothetical protein